MVATSELKIIITGQDKASGPLSKVTGSLQKLGRIAAIGAGAAVAGIAALSVGAIKLAKDASGLETVQAAFEGIAEASGESSAAVLKSFQEQSAGMINNRSLMESYNKAAQLVGTTFANQLPDAMGMVGKVAAATGQDMGFLLDSLVTGIGRLSPMILDNLGVQVDLTQAYEDFADANGLVASELSKTQQQEALTNQVMEKLASNTASMPELAGSAAASFAAFSTTLQNTKDQIGLALLPAIQPLMESLGKLAATILPPLIEIFTNSVVPALQSFMEVISQVVNFIGLFITAIDMGADPLTAFNYAVYNAFPPEVAQRIIEIKDQIVAFVDKVKEALAPVIEFIKENVEMQDVLIALGVVIAATVIPAIISIITSLAPLIAIFLAVVAVVALLRKVWEEDWHGIRTTLTYAWENHIKPALEAAWEWLSVNIPAAIKTVSDWWNNTFIPTLEAVVLGIQNVVTWFQNLGAKISAIASAIANFDWGALKAIISESPAPMAVGLAQVVDGMKNLGTEIIRLKKLSEGVNFVDDILMAAGTLASLGSGFASRLAKEQLDPIDDKVKLFTEKLRRYFDAYGVGQFDNIEQLKASEQWMDLEVWQRERILELEKEQNKLALERAEAEAKILAFQKQQADLQFLQEQMKLIQLIKEYGLNPSDILGGMTLGLDASMEELLAAMTAAMQAIIQAANEELGISSPSKVFEKLGNFVMQGFAKGIDAASALPQQSFSRSVPAMATSYNSSNTMGNVYINNPAQMAVYLRQHEMTRMRTIGSKI